MVFSILGVSGNSETRHLTNFSKFSYKWTSLALLHAARDGRFSEKWTWVSRFLAFEVFRRFFLFLAGFSCFENSKNQMDGFLMDLLLVAGMRITSQLGRKINRLPTAA